MNNFWIHSLLLLIFGSLFLLDGIHGKTISRDQKGFDERMVRRRDRTRTESPVIHQKLETRNSTRHESNSAEATENPLYSDEMEEILNTLSSSNDTSTEYEEEDEETNKFTSSEGKEITMEHVDFVMLRLQHISERVSSNLTEILELQKAEFKLNPTYQEGWENAVNDYKIKTQSRKSQILTAVNNSKSVVYQVPEEYHIALVAYTNHYPLDLPMYYDFNSATRQVCSGKDIDTYHYKSYFKLLELAIKALNKEPKLRDHKRFLYRGIGSKFALKEGQVLAFQQYVSTSATLSVAEEFASKTLLEIEGYYETGLNVNYHSEFAEEEVLFYPLQVFKVDSIHVGKYYTRYVLVGHQWKGIDPENRGKGCLAEEANEVGVGEGTKAHKFERSGATKVRIDGTVPLLFGMICVILLRSA